MDVVTLFSYGSAVVKSLNDRRPFIVFAHFLYHSSKKGYISAGWSLDEQCRVMPVVDNYGNVTKTRKKILFPAKGSKWVGLMGKNPWRGENYIELGVDYKSSGCFAGNYTSEELKQIGVKVVKWILGE